MSKLKLSKLVEFIWPVTFFKAVIWKLKNIVATVIPNASGKLVYNS